ncbi:histidine--tRNA ligase [Candidatus Bipolaricaulota bacterium]|nr:histidine--tRNA ligase [Candidatus Bipolaricaulota bacterium]MBS3825184.1 histidine--tRNA ligase [Candidatus Bipolaricaulota bacterium]
MKYYAPKGLNDITPDDMPYWHAVESEVRATMPVYGYEEIRTPMMEKTEVFARGVGEETDVVEKEMYTFDDKGGRSMTLRPENTASVVRAYLEHKYYGKEELSKWYYLGPMFRYEAPQKGRSRQFHQYGAEAIGSNDPALDAEMINLATDILTSLGLNEVGLSLNSIGCPDDREEYIEELVEYLNPFKEELCEDCQARLETNPLRILDCKNQACSSIVEDGPEITDYLCSECRDHFKNVKKYLDQLNLSYTMDPNLVRGLDYYTKTVFEVFSSDLGAQDALVGGGRYDGLVELFGGDPTPAVGFAGGIERLVLLLEELEGVELKKRELDVYLATLDRETKRRGLKLVQRLRNSGFKTEIDYLEKSLQGQLGYADRYGADVTAILGPQELSEDEITLRDMETGEQTLVPLSDFTEKVKNLLESE